MATFARFQSFLKALAENKHNLGSDQIKVALVAAANAPDLAADTQLSDLTEAAYTYCSSRNVTTSSSAQTSGVYKLVLADLVLTASGGGIGPFRYIVFYNDTAANDDLIGMLDYGSDVTVPDGGTFTIDFNASNGVFTIGS